MHILIGIAIVALPAAIVAMGVSLFIDHGWDWSAAKVRAAKAYAWTFSILFLLVIMPQACQPDQDADISVERYGR